LAKFAEVFLLFLAGSLFAVAFLVLGETSAKLLFAVGASLKHLQIRISNLEAAIFLMFNGGTFK